MWFGEWRPDYPISITMVRNKPALLDDDSPSSGLPYRPSPNTSSFSQTMEPFKPVQIHAILSWHMLCKRNTLALTALVFSFPPCSMLGFVLSCRPVLDQEQRVKRSGSWVFITIAMECISDFSGCGPVNINLFPASADRCNIQGY
ncbi:hypothetical protein VFPPC_17515 [Pochonia chlamydosporia 170]|uniref:Uncharacterized protein n=1 Tax=Pochonia chlamydosporia 170 TaxID=1380566 RepID=A0A219ARS5_METCM|nr:hypothetical protein VFPPC_17515 [Pochonia chlamydosporia 170]OWT43322.1 hypothetical protein VFPPC_17515 [Pochonia chlamydosporia 170]